MSQKQTILKLFLIAVFCLAFFGAAGEVFASTITIGTDKFATIDGKKTFVMGAHNICNYDQDNQYGNGDCAEAINKFNNFTVAYNSLYRGTIGEWGYTQEKDTYMNNVETMYANAGIYYAMESGYAEANLSAKSLFGYAQSPEEITEESQYQQAKANYDTVRKVTDIGGHPMIIANIYYDYGRTYNTGDIADIGLLDVYSYVVDCGFNDRYYHNPPTCTEGPRMLDDFLFAKEAHMHNFWLNRTEYGSGYSTLDAMPKPTWTIEGGLGSNYDEAQKTFVVMPKQELRAFVYWSAVVGATGTVFWGAKINAPHGLDTNATVAKYYNDLAGEITKTEMNDILTLPTLNYSWNYYLPWDNKVTFSSNNLKTVDGLTGYTLVYRLKYNAATDKYYLIVVNKDSKAVNNVNITISGSEFSGTRPIRTMGTVGTGSSAPNRSLILVEGKFTDTFDGYAAHIYQICAEGGSCTVPVPPPPAPDTTLPEISITCPPTGQTYSSNSISLSGTASDNIGVSKVEVKVGTSGTYQTATGTTSWSISDLILANGANTVYARAFDAAGNTKETSIVVTYDSAAVLSNPTPSVITTNGSKILVNGKPTFIVSALRICSDSTSWQSGQESCADSVGRNPSIKYQFSTNVSTSDFADNGQMNTMKSAGTFISLKFGEGITPTSPWSGGTGLIDAIFSKGLDQYSNFFGYHIDEPTGNGNNTAEYLASLKTYIKETKGDVNHPVMINLCCTGVYGKGLNYWKNSADIFSNDEYTYSTWWSEHANTKDTAFTYPMADYMYGFEWMAKNNVFGADINDLDSFGKPVGDIVQANAVNEGSVKTLNTKQIRSRAYQSIAIGYDFINWWSYGAASTANIPRVFTGFAASEARNQEMQNISAELTSLGPIFLFSRTAYSWQYQKDNASVSFSPNPSKYISGLQDTFYALNYRLIKDPATNAYYLIVINKDANLVSTTIAVKALEGTGTMHARTLGTTGTGSGAPGRTLTLTDGIFSAENLEGYAANIYQIYSGDTPPALPPAIGASLPPACTAPPPPASLCGNGVIDPPDEVCDTLNNFGCPASSACNSSCTLCAPVAVCSPKEGDSCTSKNMCGDISSPGAILCNGSCSSPIPPLDPQVNQLCSSPLNSCNQSASGYTDCSGLCKAVSPPLPLNYGKDCFSAQNQCNQSSPGKVGCSGCSAAPPALPANLDDSNSCTIDTCDKDGNIYHSNSCGGLIPCGRAGDNPATADIDESQPCTLCAFFYLLKNIINYIMTLAIGIGVFVLVLAGLLYAYSAGDQQKINLAKSALTSTLAGLTIVFIAWLLVAAVLQGMGYGSIATWNQVGCGV